MATFIRLVLCYHRTLSHVRNPESIAPLRILPSFPMKRTLLTLLAIGSAALSAKAFAEPVPAAPAPTR